METADRTAAENETEKAAPETESAAKESAGRNEVPVETKSAEEISAASPEIDQKLSGLAAAIAAADERLAALGPAVEALSKQVSLIPPQVRNVASKVEGLNASISEPRLRSLLQGMVAIFDLVNNLCRAEIPQSADPALAELAARNYRTIRTQLLQLFESNGLRLIDPQGDFDPKEHQAIKQVTCDDERGHGKVIEVIRPGFRTEQAVLRYAEVTVGRFAPAEAETPSSE